MLPERRSFNGAALFQVRKLISPGDRCVWQDGASMGPHSFKCGSTIAMVILLCILFGLQWGRTLSSAEVRRVCSGISRIIPGFNGAALFQVRKLRQHRPPQQCPTSFNGAALFQVRKSIQGKNAWPIWQSFNGAALFQVRKYEHHQYRPPKRTSFNGAALFQVRKFVRPFSPGISARASMGPHSFKCGSTRRNLKPLGGLDASMGPHSFKCGSIDANVRRRFGHVELQWGRTLSSAEVRTCSGSADSRTSASMGPHSFKCGSSPPRGRRLRPPQSFNGAALFQVRKFYDGDETPRMYFPGFNGAALFQVRKYALRNCASAHKDCFNGAALFQVRK